MKKTIAIGLILVLMMLSGCKPLSKAEFTNLTPAEIKMDDITYLMTDEVLSAEYIEKKIGKVTLIHAIVSYPEDKNPYKNPSKIYKIKDQSIEEAIAIKVNGKIYIAYVK